MAVANRKENLRVALGKLKEWDILMDMSLTYLGLESRCENGYYDSDQGYVSLLIINVTTFKKKRNHMKSNKPSHFQRQFCFEF